MQDLTALYKKSGTKKCLGNFYRSQPFSDVYAFLSNQGVPSERIIIKTHAAKGTPSQTLVHPMLALTFLQWADATAYCKTLQKLLANMDPLQRSEIPQEGEEGYTE